MIAVGYNALNRLTNLAVTCTSGAPACAQAQTQASYTYTAGGPALH